MILIKVALFYSDMIGTCNSLNYGFAFTKICSH